MTDLSSKLRVLPCLDSREMAEHRRRELELRPELAESLGRSAVEAIELGYYLTDHGKVEWLPLVANARDSKISIPPEAELPTPSNARESADAIARRHWSLAQSANQNATQKKLVRILSPTWLPRSTLDNVLLSTIKHVSS